MLSTLRLLVQLVSCICVDLSQWSNIFWQIYISVLQQENWPTIRGWPNYHFKVGVLDRFWLFNQTLNNAWKPFNSIHSINKNVVQNSHSKVLFIQNTNQNIHSKTNFTQYLPQNIHSKNLFIQLWIVFLRWQSDQNMIKFMHFS